MPRPRAPRRRAVARPGAAGSAVRRRRPPARRAPNPVACRTSPSGASGIMRPQECGTSGRRADAGRRRDTASRSRVAERRARQGEEAHPDHRDREVEDGHLLARAHEQPGAHREECDRRRLGDERRRGAEREAAPRRHRAAQHRGGEEVRMPRHPHLCSSRPLTRRTSLGSSRTTVSAIARALIRCETTRTMAPRSASARRFATAAFRWSGSRAALGSSSAITAPTPRSAGGSRARSRRAEPDRPTARYPGRRARARGRGRPRSRGRGRALTVWPRGQRRPARHCRGSFRR